MPTPNVYTHPEWNPFADVPVELQGDTVSVLYVTDRIPDSETARGMEYGYGRSRSAAFGNATVQIGDGLTWDELVEASRTGKRAKKLEIKVVSTEEVARFEKTPPTLVISDAQLASGKGPHFTEKQIEAEKAFQENLSQRLALTPNKEVFVFVHGFNDTFEYSVLETAEMWHFLGREGVPVCYSWPAGEGLLKAYEYTLDSTDFTVYHFKQALRLIAANPDVKKINILCHSRGTAVTTDTLREMYLEVKHGGEEAVRAMKFGTLALAAADIDLDVAIQRDAAERVGRAVERSAIYFSDHDHALGLSSWLFGGVLRLGDIKFEIFNKEEIEVLRKSHRVQMVDAKVKDLGDFNHAYFHTSPAVSSDIVLLFRYGLLPGAEYGRPLDVSDDGYWIVRDGYPGPDWTMPTIAEER